MQPILNEITKLRKRNPISFNYKNSNRYRIITRETNGTQTAYCFSAPIYNQNTRKLVDLQFHPHENGSWCAYGSNAEITVAEHVVLKNDNGVCHISLQEETTEKTKKIVFCGQTEIYPTLNGVAVKVPCSQQNEYKMRLSCDRPFFSIWSNDRYLSLMSEEHRPFLIVSCIGALDSNEHMIAPCALEYQKNSDKEFTLSFHQNTPCGEFVQYEINLYESKLIQDTTVESLHPKLNNAFGGMAFLGKTVAYGEQWLYSRLDYSKIPDIIDKRINRAILHLPIYAGKENTVSAYQIARRFCSFGSKWNNRIPAVEAITVSSAKGGFISLDITDLIADKNTHYFKFSEGMVLKAETKGNSFSAIATGDSSYKPQILEIGFW